MTDKNNEWYDLDVIPNSIEPVDVLIELAHRNVSDGRVVLSHAQFAHAMSKKQGYDRETLENLVEITLLHLNNLMTFNNKVLATVH